jgi:hypothetical protein
MFLCTCVQFLCVKSWRVMLRIKITPYRRLNMKLDIQSIFGLHVQCTLHSCTHWLRPSNPFPRIWAHILRRCLTAKIDDISLWAPSPYRINVRTSSTDVHQEFRCWHHPYLFYYTSASDFTPLTSVGVCRSNSSWMVETIGRKPSLAQRLYA